MQVIDFLTLEHREHLLDCLAVSVAVTWGSTVFDLPSRERYHVICNNHPANCAVRVVLVIPAAGVFRFAYSRGEGVSNWLVYKGPYQAPRKRPSLRGQQAPSAI
jgi:hypothetical protein